MWRGTRWYLLKIEYPHEVRGTIARHLPSSASSISRRKRQYINTNSAHPTSSSSFAQQASRNGIARSDIDDAESSKSLPSTRRVCGRSSGLARELKPGERIQPNASFPSGGSYAGSSFSSSQRARYRAFRDKEQAAKESEALRGGAAASLLTPLPKKYGFYDGIDEHGVEPVRPTHEARRKLLQDALESQAVSVVEFTDGGEADIDLNGLPESEYHGSSGWTTIPRDSALFNSVYTKDELESRQRTNSWRVARLGTAITATTRSQELIEKSESLTEEAPEVLDGARRRRHHDEGGYSDEFEGELLEPTLESVGQPRSVYGLRKMYVKGLVGYQGIISRAEEACMCDELLQLLQHPKAAYIAEELRYCVNLYESGDLGLTGKDTLAFAFSRAPTLQRVLYRLFFLGLIPSPPNVCQISEMVGTFSGYPVHHKPASIGAYLGLLNLVSATVVHLQHRDCPWYPRLHVNPRSLFVVTQPCLGEYGMGYKQTHQPFHSFEYATRVSKDYRIEVLFATVETAHNKSLNEAICLTEYAQKRLASNDTERWIGPEATSEEEEATAPSSIDPWLKKIRNQLHGEKAASSMSSQPHSVSSVGAKLASNTLFAHGNGNSDLGMEVTVVDGHTLRQKLEARLLVGRTPKSIAASTGKPSPDGAWMESPLQDTDGTAKTRGILPHPAQKRLDLKTRHEFAKLLKSKTFVYKSKDGPTLIRGRAPYDGKDF